MNLHAVRSRAHACQAQRNYAAAIEIWRDVLSVDPLVAEAHAGLAAALLGARRTVGAEAEARAALALDATNLTALHTLAGVALTQNKRRRALEHLDHMLEIDPDCVEALVLKATTYRVYGYAGEAAQAIDEALARRPGSISALIERAWQARVRRDYAEVEAIAGSILAHNPQHVAALVLMGHAQLGHGNREEARTLALAALEQDATDYDALELLAIVKTTRNPLAGGYWYLLRALSRLSVNARFLLSGLTYLAYLMTLSTIDWLRLPDLVSTLFVIFYMFLSLGIFVTARVIVWQVRRESRQVRLSRSY
jgi:tetratricopeptide (TPR) repeat protein